MSSSARGWRVALRYYAGIARGRIRRFTQTQPSDNCAGTQDDMDGKYITTYRWHTRIVYTSSPTPACALCRLCVCVFLCSHWSLVDVPLIFFCPADHVPDWQPRVLLGMVEARSVNVKKTTTTTTTPACVHSCCIVNRLLRRNSPTRSR